ncbi:hypothetical protein F5Y03DRAFT_393841 [Xylaria venustula]|nr:hypothetical protein F5Y03DRAFT_393841 [Xylaria venustula]
MSTPADDNNSDPWDKETKRKFQKYATFSVHTRARLTRLSSPFSKSKSEYFDPCQEAASKSIRCLNRNGGDRAMCTDYFEAYRACKKEWINKRKEEKKKSGGFFS